MAHREGMNNFSLKIDLIRLFGLIISLGTAPIEYNIHELFQGVMSCLTPIDCKHVMVRVIGVA